MLANLQQQLTLDRMTFDLFRLVTLPVDRLLSGCGCVGQIGQKHQRLTGCFYSLARTLRRSC